MPDPVKIGFYILLLLPGFIFIQILEYHLLREKKPQFEKTIEIVLWSALIWAIAISLPKYWPVEESRKFVLAAIHDTLSTGKRSSNQTLYFASFSRGIPFFLSVCGWALVISNLWGYLSRKSFVDGAISKLTDRSWHSSTQFYFYHHSLACPVSVRTAEFNYIGVLCSAPDTQDDSYIVINRIHLWPDEGTPVPFPDFEEVLIRISEITEIARMPSSFIKPTPASVSTSEDYLSAEEDSDVE